jgi:hypothetical protein
MGRLRLYTHADGSTALHESGFSWLAAIALPIWALQRGLRRVAVAAFVLGLVPGMAALLLALPQRWSLGLSVVTVLASGVLAAPLHARWLRRRGWVLTAEEPARGTARASRAA